MDLNSGVTDTYTLQSLLGEDIRLIIPDMQRDYCWGTETGSPAKAPIFVSALVSMYLSGRSAPLGILYGYSQPKGSGHIHIIDGQQRLTTLYLLIGMLYRRTPTPDLRSMLISDYRLLDDRQPRLIYQVRSEAMYFMSDLVTNFFLDRNGRLSQLEKSTWYYTKYDSDPTIQSFVSALRQIDTVLEEAAKNTGWDFSDFARYVTQGLTFTYHDLGARHQAEEMFVTINTTGQPLTLPQIYKSALAIGDTSDMRMAKWEEIEQWAWIHRDRNEPQPSTSDHTTLRIMELWAASSKSDILNALDTAKFESLYHFFKAYRTLVSHIPEANTYTASNPSHCFLVIPTVAYIARWKYDEDHGEKNIKRFWDFLANITQYQRVSASGSDMRAALEVVRLMPEPEIVSLHNVAQGLPERIINQEERAKIALLATVSDPDKAYRIIERAQRHPMLSGRLERLIAWSTNKSGEISIEALERYTDYIYEIWGTDIERNPGLDNVRAALLTLRHSGYPIVRRGEINLSLCWHDYDWQRLMQNSPGTVRQLIDRTSSFKIPIKDAIRKMSERFTDHSNPFYLLIKHPEVMAECARRMIIRPSEPFIGYYIYDTASDKVGALRWYIEQLALPSDCLNWRTLRAYGARCLYTDHRTLNLSIDLHYTPDQSSKYRIEVFCRPDSSREAPGDIAAWVKGLGFPIRYDGKRKRHCTYLPDARAAAEMMRCLMKNA